MALARHLVAPFPLKAVSRSTTDSVAVVLLPEFQVPENNSQVPGSLAKKFPIDALLIEKFRVGWHARVGCPIPIGRVRKGSAFLFSVVVHQFSFYWRSRRSQCGVGQADVH